MNDEWGMKNDEWWCWADEQKSICWWFMLMLMLMRSCNVHKDVRMFTGLYRYQNTFTSSSHPLFLYPCLLNILEALPSSNVRSCSNIRSTLFQCFTDTKTNFANSNRCRGNTLGWAMDFGLFFSWSTSTALGGLTLTAKTSQELQNCPG